MFSVALLSLTVWLLSPPGLVRADSHLSPLVIVTEEGARHDFLVEFADTPAERAQGLMFRRSLAENRGMLFDFGKNEDIQMWMKNTYIPLDMVFLRENGVIHRVERDTEPHSLRVISSFGKVRGVLELPAGTAARLGLRPGDRIKHQMFDEQ